MKSDAHILRYRDLVDKSYLTGLTPEEEVEMQELADKMDEQFTPFYAPILKQLQQQADRLTVNGTVQIIKPAEKKP